MDDLSHLSVHTIKALLRRRKDLLDSVVNYKPKHWTGPHPMDDEKVQFHVAKYGTNEHRKKLLDHPTFRPYLQGKVAHYGGPELYDKILEKKNLHPSAISEIYFSNHAESIKKLYRRNDIHPSVKRDIEQKYPEVKDGV